MTAPPSKTGPTTGATPLYGALPTRQTLVPIALGARHRAAHPHRHNACLATCSTSRATSTSLAPARTTGDPNPGGEDTGRRDLVLGLGLLRCDRPSGSWVLVPPNTDRRAVLLSPQPLPANRTKASSDRRLRGPSI